VRLASTEQLRQGGEGRASEFVGGGRAGGERPRVLVLLTPPGAISSAETSPIPTRSAVALFLARVVAVLRRSFSTFCRPLRLLNRTSSAKQ
jgi:hypothetical protein